MDNHKTDLDAVEWTLTSSQWVKQVDGIPDLTEAAIDRQLKSKRWETLAAYHKRLRRLGRQ